MKQRPILFNTEMVQAILAGRKTQTRRVVKPQPELTESGFKWKGFCYGIGSSDERTNRNFAHAACPYGKPGDVLWVRETLEQSVTGGALYRAGGKVGESLAENEFLNWDDFSTTRKVIPSIHMPKDAARIWLRIKDVRVERLQDISNEDIRAEGAAEFGCTTHRLNWQTLWESVNGSDSWKDNPFVWVIEFERIEKP